MVNYSVPTVTDIRPDADIRAITDTSNMVLLLLDAWPMATGQHLNQLFV